MAGGRLFLGIDFGTSNSSIAYVYHDPRHAREKIIKVEAVQIAVDDEGIARTGRMPTIVSAQLDDKRSKAALFGWDFWRQFWRKKKNARLLRRGVSFFDSVKSDLGSFRVYPHAFSPEYNTPEKVAEAIFRHLLREAARKLSQHDIEKSRVVVTVPASLGAESRQQTKEAAQRAGLDGDKVELIDEPIAALLHLLNDPRVAGVLETGKLKKLLVFDYGGGTLDLCLVRASFDPAAGSGLIAENVAISQYRRNGGNDIDRAVMQQVVWPQIEEQLGVGRRDIAIDLRQRIEDTFIPTVARRLKEKICSRVAKTLDEGTSWSALHKRPVTETEALDREFSDDGLPKPVRARFRITSHQFEAVMGPFLTMPSGSPADWQDRYQHSLLLPIWETVAKAGVRPDEVDALVLHGGSCRNPYVRGLLKDALAAEGSLFSHMQVLETPDLDTSVACGAALACYWKHARDEEIVAPIIAEELGVMTLSDQPVRLIEAGQPLPYPDENAVKMSEPFYVPQPGQRHMLVPFYTGTNHMLRVAGTIAVDLPPNVKRGDEVRIKFRVDRDKVVQWWYNVGGGEFQKAKPFNDPWTTRALTPYGKRLVAHRAEMRKMVMDGVPVPRDMEVTEANLLYQCGDLDEAEVLLLEHIARDGPCLRSTNVMSLICGLIGDRERELQYAAQAAALGPKDAVVVGNYGCTLADHGRGQEAVARLRAALALDPTLVYVYERLGDIYRDDGDDDAALREYQQAIRYAEMNTSRWPDWAVEWRSLERLYRKVGQYEKAAEAQRHSVDASLNDLYGGDHRMRIAGPDSGIWEPDAR